MSNDIVEGAKLPVFWGDPELQGLHIGLFIALAMALVFWVILNRTRTGFEVRAVGFNPEAARSAGISVGRNYVLVMAICGLFAGLAGSLDVLGWQFRVATNDIQISELGFLGIAVALLGRNTAVGTIFAALLCGALVTGTSVRNLDPEVFEPAAGRQPHEIIQGLVSCWSAPTSSSSTCGSSRGKLRRRPPRAGGAGGRMSTAVAATRRACRARARRLTPAARLAGVVLAFSASSSRSRRS